MPVPPHPAPPHLTPPQPPALLHRASGLTSRVLHSSRLRARVAGAVQHEQCTAHVAGEVLQVGADRSEELTPPLHVACGVATCPPDRGPDGGLGPACRSARKRKVLAQPDVHRALMHLGRWHLVQQTWRIRAPTKTTPPPEFEDCKGLAATEARAPGRMSYRRWLSMTAEQNACTPNWAGRLPPKNSTCIRAQGQQRPGGDRGPSTRAGVMLSLLVWLLFLLLNLKGSTQQHTAPHHQNITPNNR
jgi:hypothetical protein